MNINFKLWIENFDWAKDIAKSLPNLKLDLPTIKKTGRILTLEFRKNPILIRLNDGTELYLTIDQFKRIHKQPKVGNKLTVEFLQGDKKENSQIISIICED